MRQDITIGSAAVATGTGGLSVQYFIGIGSLVLIALNILLALGGLYLVHLRIRKTKSERGD